MKKRGFTLIELLAVIVILAIIALIATPIVMNLIENSKRGAAERAAENIEKAAELYYYENRLDGLFPGITFTCNSENCSSNDKVLEINGKVPEIGYIKINKEGVITLNSIIINGYNCYKENESYKCSKEKKETASSTDGVLTIDSSTTSLSNYRIYGNSIEIGPNLYQNMTFTDGYILSTNGTPSQSANYKISDYLEVEPNETYISQMMNNYSAAAGTMIRCWSYDENKNLISKLFENNRINTGIYTNEFKTPENAKYIRISYRITDTDIEFYKKNPKDGEASRFQSVGDYNSTTELYEIPVKVTSKNLYKESSFTSSTGLTVEYNPDTHIYTINGTSTNADNIWLSHKFIPDVKVGEDVTLTTEIISGTIDNNGKYVYYSMFNNDNTSYIRNQNSFLVKPGKISKSAKMISGEYMHYCIQVGGEGVTFNNVELRVQLEKGTSSTKYEPYKEENYTISLTEPLRCVDNVCDYIDYKSGKVVRNVGVESNGTLAKLKKSITQDIQLPNIKLNNGTNNIYIKTYILPSKVEMEYYK